MRSYRRLSFEEREEMSLLLYGGCGLREVARSLGRSPSTVSREVHRFGGSSPYRALSGQFQARRQASSRRGGKRKILRNPRLRAVVHDKLAEYWSPHQIAQYLKKHYKTSQMQASGETIYTYVYVLPRGVLRKRLTQSLRRAHLKRRKQGHSQNGQSSNLEDMLSIDERPASVADRCVPGHWEGDLIIGGVRQSALGTLVERTTRTVILVPLKSKTAEEVRKAFAKEIMKLPKQMRLTLTYDQGREMAQHKLFTKETQMQVYFAHPKSPWERGTNENTNGLIRQYFPRGTDFNEVSRREIKRVQDSLNGRPRKTLNWETPFEAMEKLLR